MTPTPLPQNPYIAGNPVGGSQAFVGRADVLRAVLRVLKSPGENALVLYGQRRIGKTSVLQELMARLPQEGPYQPVYFDLQDKAALPLNTVLGELSQRITGQLGLPVPGLSGDQVAEQFKRAFLPALLAQLPIDHSLVLLFDEFDVLDNPGEGQAGAAFFPYLRSLLTFNPRLQFVFVIGRRPEDLSSLTLSIFKGVKSEKISLLAKPNLIALIRLAEQNGSLQWHEAAVSQVYALTGGHPFLTQHLCQEIWEAAWQGDPATTPQIDSAAVDRAVAPTLRSATNALEWLWDGLKPAQRIVASALAEAGPTVISADELAMRLQQSGVRILVGELQDAPRTLQDWDLLEPGGAGYRFRVELLRRWLVQHKPLSRVQQEIDYIQPAAENLFQAAYAFYQTGQLAQALPLLRQAVGLNPNHVRGALLLSEILLAQDEIDEAQQLLESLYQYHPVAARPRLVQALLAQAEGEADEQRRLALLERVLVLEPQQVTAQARRQQLWLQQIQHFERKEQYQEALALAQKVAAELPAHDARRPDLAILERKTQLTTLYQQGITALANQEQTTAVQHFAQVIALEPFYRDTTHFLHLAVTGTDSVQQAKALADRQAQVQAQATKLTAAEVAKKQAEDALESERKLRRQQERELEQLRGQVNLQQLSPWRRFWKQPPPRLTWTLAALSTILLLLIFNTYGWLPTLRSSGTTANASPTPAVTPVATTTPASSSAPVAQAEPLPTPLATRWGIPPPTDLLTGTTWLDTSYVITFVYVPAGEFLMGSSDDDNAAQSDEKPPHEVTLAAFWIMQTEVTNTQYQQCVEAGACTAPNNERWNQTEYAAHPVTHVNWQQANDYAAWVGGRLPTEAEWEKAARGTDGRLYPWGNEAPDETRLNFNQNVGDTSRVGTYSSGASPYRAFDMAGNVWEWTNDWYNIVYYATAPADNPLGPASGTYRVVRGGSWNGNTSGVRSAFRLRSSPGDQHFGLGFRVVRLSSPGF